MQPNEIIEVLNRPISQELLARDVTRLAYVAKENRRVSPRSSSPYRWAVPVRTVGGRGRRRRASPPVQPAAAVAVAAAPVGVVGPPH
jgi:hypothetical protein